MKKYTTLLALLFIGVLTGYCQQSAYLFVYFTGNRMSEEAIRMAVSLDGYNYKALNGNQPVLDSRVISSTGGVRDPHILRCENGKTFYMVVTDMVSGNGWDSNRAMVLLKSKDLVHWTSNIVNIQKKYPAQENLKRVWAPQTVYDKEGNVYRLEDIIIDKSLSTNMGGGTCTNSGYFVLHYENGSGLEIPNDPIHQARRDVFCQLLFDLSEFIVPASTKFLLAPLHHRQLDLIAISKRRANP